MGENKLAVFEGIRIRKTIHNNEWWFSIIDVVEVSTGSSLPKRYCSSDILVFRAKANVMLSGLLPYYASSDAFINHAVSTSAGSLSPRTKWRDLAGFELSIPDLKIQEKIVDVFNKLSELLSLLKTQKQTLKNLKQKLLNEILG